MQKINLNDKLSLFSAHWSPKIIGSLNGQHVKLAKLKGEFVWHSHPDEDEMFFVISGMLTIAFQDHEVQLQPGEMIIIPRGIQHKPIAPEEVSVMIFEPAGTLNTGDQRGELTRDELEWI